MTHLVFSRLWILQFFQILILLPEQFQTHIHWFLSIVNTTLVQVSQILLIFFLKKKKKIFFAFFDRKDFFFFAFFNFFLQIPPPPLQAKNQKKNKKIIIIFSLLTFRKHNFFFIRTWTLWALQLPWPRATWPAVRCSCFFLFDCTPHQNATTLFKTNEKMKKWWWRFAHNKKTNKKVFGLSKRKKLWANFFFYNELKRSVNLVIFFFFFGFCSNKKSKRKKFVYNGGWFFFTKAPQFWDVSVHLKYRTFSIFNFVFLQIHAVQQNNEKIDEVLLCWNQKPHSWIKNCGEYIWNLLKKKTKAYNDGNSK